MTLPVWTTNPNTPLSLANVQTEFGGVVPISFSEYYAGAATNYVAAGTVGYPNGIAVTIPSLGSAISLSNFYGASAVVYSILTAGNVMNYNEGSTINFVITAPDANNTVLYWTFEDVTVSVNISPSTLANGTQNVAYSQTLTSTGGTGPYTYSISSGSLPTGLTLSSGGVISGSPSSPGTSTFNVQSADAGSNVGAKAYAITVVGVTITVDPSSANAAVINTPYSLTFTATGGTGPYTFTVTSGALPAGLSLNSNGVLSGTPTAVETANFTVRATDVNTNFGSRAYSIAVAPVTITVTPSTISNGTQGSAYSQQFAATGGTAPYTWSNIGTLPAGMTLSSSGLFSGTPTQSGTPGFTVVATDVNTNSGQRTLNWTVLSNVWDVTLDSYGAAPQTVNEGSNLYFTITAPNSIAANSTVYLGTGSPNTAGSSDIAVSSDPQAVVLSGLVGTGNILVLADNLTEGSEYFTVFVEYPLGTRVATYGNVFINDTSTSVTLTVSPTSFPNGVVGTAYSESMSASGGTGPYSFSVTSGTLPAGLSLSSGGVLSGTPTTAGSSSFTVTATGTVGTGNRAYTLVVDASSALISPTTFNNQKITAISDSGIPEAAFYLNANGTWTVFALDNTGGGSFSGNWRTSSAKTYECRVVSVNEITAPVDVDGQPPSGPNSWETIVGNLVVAATVNDSATFPSTANISYGIEIRSTDLVEGPVSGTVYLVAATTSSGGSGLGCPDPATLIMIDEENWLPAGSVEVGSMIYSMHHITGEYGFYKVSSAQLQMQPKLSFVFDDQSSIVVSTSHRFWQGGDQWISAMNLQAGDSVTSLTGVKTIASITDVGLGEVVKFEIEDAHTYIAAGYISHNAKFEGGENQYAN